jgi:hypothetical protein
MRMVSLRSRFSFKWQKEMPFPDFPENGIWRRDFTMTETVVTVPALKGC